MRGTLVTLMVMSLCSAACVSHPVSKRGTKVDPCRPDGTCGPGLVCVANVCVSNGAEASAGAGGGTGRQAVEGGAGGASLATEPDSGGPGSASAGTRATGGGGGSSAAGGIPFTAGTAPPTSAVEIGGDRAAGGVATTGGGPSAGGTITTGGNLAAGGTSALWGGTTASSSPPRTGPRPSGYVFFADGQANGFMDGVAWVAPGAQNTLTAPTCDAGGTPITSANPCMTKQYWPFSSGLRANGTIPALPASPLPPGHPNDRELRIGVNARDPIGSIGPDISYFNTVAFLFTPTPRTGWRAFVHRKGDPDSDTYCVDGVTPTANIPLTKFNTKCWGDPSTVYLTPADLPAIDQIGLSLLPGASDITFDMVLSGLAFYE